jgi:signal transduction histidine kinase
MSEVITLEDDILILEVVKRLQERKKTLDELNRSYLEMELLNEKLLESEVNKSRFLGIIRNEFNNPLFGIIPILDTLYNDELDKDKKDLIESAYREILILHLQLDNIIAASEIESGSLHREKSEFDFKALMIDIISILKNIHFEKEMNLETNIDINIPLYSDREKIYTVMANLLSNAYEFSKEKTLIKMDAFIDKDENLVLKVSNYSNKIKNEDKIFDSFYQENNDFNRTHRGLGIGLAITKSFLEFLGGDVHIKYDNHINTFTCTIPNILDNSDDIFDEGFMFDDFNDFDEEVKF